MSKVVMPTTKVSRMAIKELESDGVILEVQIDNSIERLTKIRDQYALTPTAAVEKMFRVEYKRAATILQVMREVPLQSMYICQLLSEELDELSEIFPPLKKR